MTKAELSAQLFDAIGNPEAVRKALEQGADPNAICFPEDGRTPLEVAIDEECLESVRLLLDAGAALEARDNNILCTPLGAAVLNGSFEIAEFLLERGADPHLQLDDSEGDTLLTSAVSRELENRNGRALIELLFRYGVDPNSPRRDGWSPLMLAATKDLALVRYLVSKGADPLQTKGEGDERTNAVIIAEYHQQDEIVAYLVSLGEKDPFPLSQERLRSAWERWASGTTEEAEKRRFLLDALQGCDSEELQALERATQVRVAPELRAQLLLHGKHHQTLRPSFAEYLGFSAAEIEYEWLQLQRALQAGAFDKKPPMSNVLHRVGYEHWYHPLWIPFAKNEEQEFLCVDMFAPLGARGKVFCWSAERGPIAVVAECVVTLVERLATMKTRVRLGAQ